MCFYFFPKLKQNQLQDADSE